jgi:predicted transglutaminase-like protease
VSNPTTKVDGYDMTIAEALVYLAQLSQNKDRLVRLANREKLVRGSTSRYSSNTEYTKACYDIAKAKEDLAKLNQTIAHLQMAIDRTNLTNLIAID